MLKLFCNDFGGILFEVIVLSKWNLDLTSKIIQMNEVFYIFIKNSLTCWIILPLNSLIFSIIHCPFLIQWIFLITLAFKGPVEWVKRTRIARSHRWRALVFPWRSLRRSDPIVHVRLVLVTLKVFNLRQNVDLLKLTLEFLLVFSFPIKLFLLIVAYKLFTDPMSPELGEGLSLTGGPDT